MLLLMNRTATYQISTDLEALIRFVRDEKFDVASVKYLDLIKAADVPLLSFYAHLSPDDLLSIAKEHLSAFLDGCLNGSLVSSHSVKLTDWKLGLIKNISREKINVADILLLNSIRKQLLLHFLPEFTNEVRIATSIMIAIEKLFVINEKTTFETYVEIQQQDISERKEFFSNLIENSINGVWVVDTESNILEWNPVMEKELNIPRGKAVGKNIFQAIPQFKGSNLGLGLENVLHHGAKIIVRDIQFPLRRGWYDSFIIPLYGGDGSMKMILCILHDITIRKKIEDRLQEHKEELQTANEELLEQQDELRNAYLELQDNNAKLTVAKNALKENEARLMEAQSIAHLGSWEYDIATNKICWSEEMKSIFGYNEDKPIDYDNYLSFIHPDDRTFVGETISHTLKTFEPYSFEHKIVRKDGSVRYILANGRAILTNKNQVVKLQGTGLDITVLKEAELEKTNNQYFIQKITETTPDLITVYDLLVKKNIYSNRPFFESLGYSPDEANTIREKRARGIKEIVHPDDYDKIRDLFHFFRSYTGHETKELEYRYKKKNGEWVWIWSRYEIFKRGDDGFPVQLLGISRDITKRKNSEEKIIENEARLKESQILAKLGYWELDLESGRTFWSDELFRIYGIPKKSPLDLSEIKSRLVPEDQQVLANAIQNTISSEAPYHLQYRIMRDDGEIRYINTTGELIKDQFGKKIKLRGIAQDITDRKIVEQKLERAYEELKETHEELKRSEESLRILNNELESRVLNRTEALQDSNERLVKINADLDNFIYTASHDLKVPIANIEGLLNILKKKVDHKLQNNDKIILNMMEESICRFNTTIKDLTQISKIQKDLEEENSEKISFEGTVNDLLCDIAHLIAEKNSKVCTKFEVDEIIFTKKNLRSILYNLLVNALKYCSAERTPEIMISTKASTEGIVLTISDNGMGIPEKQLGKIFSLFKRYHVNIEGSGIGLYIVKRIVENSGGRVYVESEVNVGTTFNIIFTNKN